MAVQLDDDDARSLAAWASSVYGDLPVRLVGPEALHVTLMFYPSVTDQQLAEMIRLVRTERWVVMDAELGATRMFGRTALGVELHLEPDRRELLANRILRGDPSSRDFELNRHRPLGQLVVMQGEPELEKLRRNLRKGQPLHLHVTFGRAKESVPLIDPPALRIRLGRLALFESHLSPEGSRYEKLAEAVSVGEMPHGYT